MDIEVGAHVIYGSNISDFRSEVIAIHEQWAWCRPLFVHANGQRDLPFTAPLKSLRLIQGEYSDR